MGFSAGVGFLVDTDGDGTTDGKAVVLKQGTNITMSLSGSTLTIGASGSGGSVRTVTAGGNTLASGETLAFTAGTGITIAETGGAVTITNSVTDTNTQLTQEQVEDYVNGLIVGGTNVTATYDDAAGTLTLAATDTNTQLTLLDEDNFASDSATAAASQQSIKAYVDSVAQGLDVKTAVAVATTASISLTGEQTIDGVTTSTDRILVKDQSTASQNGIYVTAAGGWARATDMNTSVEFASTFVFVSGGTVGADTGWVCTVDTDFVMDTDNATFTQFSNAGHITAGTNITKSGNTLNVADAFLVNDASDTTTGTITAGGFTTAGTWTMDTSAGGTTGITSINITNAFTDDDVTIMSAGAIKEKIEGYAYTTNTGDITAVNAGTGMSGGGSSGSVTLTNAGVTSIVAGSNISISGATGAVTVTGTDTNTQTTYTPSVVDDADDALIRLTAAGAGSGTQDIKLVAGSNITLTPNTGTSPHQITIAASGGSGDITGVDLTGGTGITIGSETGTTSGDYSATITNAGVTSIVAGSGISISGATGAVTVTASGGGSSLWAYDGTITTKLQPSGTLVSGITEVSYTQGETAASSASAAHTGTNANVVRYGVASRYNMTVVHPDADAGSDIYTVDANDHHIVIMNMTQSDGTMNPAPLTQTVQLPAAANFIGREIKISWYGAGALATGGLNDIVFVKPSGDDSLLYGGIMWDNNQAAGAPVAPGTSTGGSGMIIGPAAYVDAKWYGLGMYWVQSVTLVAVDLATMNTAAGGYNIIGIDGVRLDAVDVCTSNIWLVTDVAGVSCINSATAFGAALIGAGMDPAFIGGL